MIHYLLACNIIYIYACDTLLACMFSQTTTNTFNQMFFRGKLCQLFRRVHFREILSPFQRHQGLAPRITFVASTWFKMFKFQMQFEEIILEILPHINMLPFHALDELRVEGPMNLFEFCQIISHSHLSAGPLKSGIS